MTVKQLKKFLRKIPDHYPVQILVVDDNIPFAQDIEVGKAEDYDGERVWIYPQSERHPPEWA